MLVAIYFFHAFAFMIAFIYLMPGKRDYNYKAIFKKDFPIFYPLSFWLYIIVIFYFIIDFYTKGWIGVNYVDSFDTKKC